MKTRFLLPVILLFIPVICAAQVTFYKVKGGVNTPVKTSEEIEINLDDNLVPDCNILVELDLKAFKTAYKYDDILISYFDKDGNWVASFNFTFDSQLNLKKYGEAKTVRFYLFSTSDAKEDNNNITLIKPSVSFSDSKKQYYIQIAGRYREREEEYYDNGAWKTRDIWSKNEPLAKFTTSAIKYKPSEGAVLVAKFDQLINRGYGEFEGLKGIKAINDKVTEHFKTVKSYQTNIPVVGTSPNYPQVYEAMSEIVKSRESEITGISDKKQALAKLEQWNQDYTYLLVGNKDKDVLKSLNKELKGASSVSDKMEIFKKYGI